MKRKLIAVATAAMIGLTAAAIPNKAEAHWHGGGWWIPGAILGGLALGAIASRPYYYYGYPGYYYDYGPGYYGYAPYYGGYYYYHRPYYRYRYYYRHPYYRHRYYRHY